MKHKCVTVTLFIGKQRKDGLDWEEALHRVRVMLALRRLNTPERFVAYTAIGLQYAITGRAL